MAEEQNEDVLIEKLRERGVNCNHLKAIETRERKEASEFRKLEFLNLARAQENSADVIKSLRAKVCKLR